MTNETTHHVVIETGNNRVLRGTWTTTELKAFLVRLHLGSNLSSASNPLVQLPVTDDTKKTVLVHADHIVTIDIKPPLEQP